MKEYSLVVTLPSCRIQIADLKTLERYITTKVTSTRNVPPEEVFKDFSIIIDDPIGRETLNSLEELHSSLLADGTKSLTINYSTYKDPIRMIRIHLDSRGSRNSEIEIKMSGEFSKETAIGIASEIQQILLSSKNWNWLFHPHPLVSGILGGLLFYPLVVSVISLFRASWVTFYFSTLINLTFLIYFYTAWVTPFINLPTRRNEAIEKQISWLVYGSIGFLLFSVIGVFFRKQIFGF